MDMRAWLSHALGFEPGHPLTTLQMCLRTCIVYAVSLALFRLGSSKRLMGRHAAFDAILVVIFASMISRAINGSAPFFQTLGASAFFVLLHWAIAWLAYVSPFAGFLVKGRELELIRDGKIRDENLRHSLISERDLKEFLRLKAKLEDTARVRSAILERNGEVSVRTE